MTCARSILQKPVSVTRIGSGSSGVPAECPSYDAEVPEKLTPDGRYRTIRAVETTTDFHRRMFQTRPVLLSILAAGIAGGRQ
jgi:hypothetical protein